MAVMERGEVYSHATIDCADMTLTEYGSDGVCTYSIEEIIKRWDGIPDIEIKIWQRTTMPFGKE